MKYHVRHVTDVHYENFVKLARFNLRLRPAEWPGQTLVDYRLSIVPAPREIIETPGPFVVNVARIEFDRPTANLALTSAFTVDVDRSLPPPGTPGPDIASIREQALAARGLSATDPATYLFATPITAMEEDIAAWAAPLLANASGVVTAASALMRTIHDEFAYDGGATSADTPPIAAFRNRRGVCQDFAHVMIVALRHHGIPAAYVSGYLRTFPPPGEARLVGADATHAWVNVWCGPSLGWIGFDPTNAVMAGNDHIFTAMGRDFADVSPLDGVFIGGAGQRMKVSVEVAPV